MLQTRNATPFEAKIVPMPDPDGVDTMFVIVKGTFDIKADGVEPAAEQRKVQDEDEFHDTAENSSLLVASDLAMLKPGTDVLLNGFAYAPDGRPATTSEVTLEVGTHIRKTVTVVGDRHWSTGLLGTRASAPAPFDRIPLQWEYAYGGSEAPAEAGGDDALATPGDPRNPVGRGYRSKQNKSELDGQPLPNFELAGERLSNWKQRPQPAGFGALCSHWQPRVDYAGTYDDVWQKQRAPYLPKDFDPRFFQLAPADQTVEGYLSGGEPVTVRGATASGELHFEVPRGALHVRCQVDGRATEQVAALDTLTIDAETAQFSVVWRAAFRCDKKLLRIERVETEWQS